MTDPDDLLSISQAAQFLQVSETSLRRWTNAGHLACLRVGLRRERRFRRGALMDFMEQQPGIHTVGAEASLDSPRGHSVVGGVETAHGTHVCGMYESDRARVQLTTGFLSGSLRSGHKTFLVTSPGIRRGLLKNLQEERPSLKAEIDAGRLSVSHFAKNADAQLAYFHDEFDRALSAGARSLRVLGDAGGLASLMPPNAIADYESAYSELIAARYPVVTLCLYDIRVFSSSAILTALRGHPDSLNPSATRWLA